MRPSHMSIYSNGCWVVVLFHVQIRQIILARLNTQPPAPLVHIHLLKKQPKVAAQSDKTKQDWMLK